MLHGLFGPKFQTTGPVRVFLVTKFGFVNFGVSTATAPTGFVNSFGGVVDDLERPSRVRAAGDRTSVADDRVLLSEGTFSHTILLWSKLHQRPCLTVMKASA